MPRILIHATENFEEIGINSKMLNSLMQCIGSRLNLTEHPDPSDPEKFDLLTHDYIRQIGAEGRRDLRLVYMAAACLLMLRTGYDLRFYQCNQPLSDAADMFNAIFVMREIHSPFDKDNPDRSAYEQQIRERREWYDWPPEDGGNVPFLVDVFMPEKLRNYKRAVTFSFAYNGYRDALDYKDLVKDYEFNSGLVFKPDEEIKGCERLYPKDVDTLGELAGAAIARRLRNPGDVARLRLPDRLKQEVKQSREKIEEMKELRTTHKSKNTLR